MSKQVEIENMTSNELIDEYIFISTHTSNYDYALALYNEIVYRNLNHYYDFITLLG